MKYNAIEKYKHIELEEFTYLQLEAEDELSVGKQNLIVYEPFETIFNHKGVAVLDSVENSKVLLELNGNYSLTVEVAKDNHGKYKRIKPLSIIKSRGQLFRVPQIDGIKDGGFKLKLYAEHISYDARELFTVDRRVNNQLAYEAMTRLLETDVNKKYKLGASDLKTTANANFINENFIESLFKKVLPRWNGELERDNHEFTILSKIGEYKPNLYIRFGKNSKSISVKVDYGNLCTKIYPTGANGIGIEEVNNGINYLISPKIKDYPIEYPKHVKFEDAETPRELKDMAIEYFKKNDTPSKIVEVDLIELERNEAYENLKSAIKMNLGDTVTVFDDDFNIEDELRVISIEMDGETGVKLNIKLGEFAQSIVDSMTETEDRVNDVEERINESIETSQDVKDQVVKNTSKIIELEKVNENLNKDITEVNKEVGQLAALETVNKENLVSAINEVDKEVSDNTLQIEKNTQSLGDTNELQTEYKENIVGAINDIKKILDKTIEDSDISNIKREIKIINGKLVLYEEEQMKIINILKDAGMYPDK